MDNRLDMDMEELGSAEKKSDIVQDLHDFLRSIGLNDSGDNHSKTTKGKNHKKSKKHKKRGKRDAKKEKRKKKKRNREREAGAELYSKISNSDKSSADHDLLKKLHRHGTGSDYWIHSSNYWNNNS